MITMEGSQAAQTSTDIHLNTEFCLRMANHILLKEIADHEKGSNFILSPLSFHLSFHLMLSLTAVGSTGPTLEQLLLCLGSKDIGDLNLSSSRMVAITSSSTAAAGGPLLSSVNGVWVDKRFNLKSSFESIVKGIYQAEAKEVDFATKTDQVVEEVNSSVENATRGLIKTLLPTGCLDPNTTLVLANALYFKGSWNQKFDPSRTENRDFHLLNGQTIQVPFMTCKKYERHLYRSFADYRLLKIPYQNGQDTRQFSMHIFLPNERNGLESLLYKLHSNPGLLNHQFELRKQELPDFWIPRFRFSYNLEASETMKELGIELPFSNVGEFAEMVDFPASLCLSNIFHKSYIEVNEQGTEAAASTAPVFVRQCGKYLIPSFVADHPFMFHDKGRDIWHCAHHWDCTQPFPLESLNMLQQ